MADIQYDLEEGKLLITKEFDTNATEIEDETPYLREIGDEYIIKFDDLEKVKNLTRFTYDTLGIKEDKFLLQYYRISRDNNSWSQWYDLNINITNFPTVDTLEPLYLEIKWVRKGSDENGFIRILEYRIEGELDREEKEFTGEQAVSIQPGEYEIVKAPFIYKVFNLEDIQIIGITNLDNVDIEYRFSQDNSRNWSEWEAFTKENITTKRINPIRFFEIEFKITNNSASISRIQDINLVGSFQNVSKDYRKTNLFGIRECCKSNQVGYIDSNGNYILNDNLNSSGYQCDNDGNVFSPMSDSEKGQLYNPYAQTEATNLLEKLSADSEQMLGHKVTYFATDPDENGQDHTLNEYQLYNVSCQADLKISIDGNNFPDSQIKMNIFDLDLFDSMEAHVTKQQFKQMFGVQRRPSKEDFIHFCQVNRMYQVDHAQQFRGFNNTAVYYKLILKKYNQKANVQASDPEIRSNIDELTNNTTIDELFGVEIKQDKKAVANKEQHYPLSREPIRLDYFAEIDKELIENSTTVISKGNYDLSSIPYDGLAVQYKNFNSSLKVSDNLSYQIWFNINNYLRDEVYKFIEIYDESLSKGWKLNLKNDAINLTLNDSTYTFDLSGDALEGDPMALEEDTWYCLVTNINQRQRNVEHFIYKRNVDLEEDAPSLASTILRKEYYDKQDIETFEYNIENNPKILASDMKVTNIRLFSDVLPESVHNKVLNQYIIGDNSKYLIFADNATQRIHLPNFPLNENF
jgi:hypothetical protein